MPFDPSSYEPLISDPRLAVIDSKLRAEFRLEDTTKLVTFVQPPMEHEGRALEAKAVFAAVSPNPRHGHLTTMQHATTSLAYWRERNKEWSRMAGRPDPAEQAFRLLLPHHLEVLANFRALI